MRGLETVNATLQQFLERCHEPARLNLHARRAAAEGGRGQRTIHKEHVREVVQRNAHNRRKAVLPMLRDALTVGSADVELIRRHLILPLHNALISMLAFSSKSVSLEVFNQKRKPPCSTKSSGIAPYAPHRAYRRKCSSPRSRTRSRRRGVAGLESLLEAALVLHLPNVLLGELLLVYGDGVLGRALADNDLLGVKTTVLNGLDARSSGANDSDALIRQIDALLWTFLHAFSQKSHWSSLDITTYDGVVIWWIGLLNLSNP